MSLFQKTYPYEAAVPPPRAADALDAARSVRPRGRARSNDPAAVARIRYGTVTEQEHHSEQGREG